MVVRTGTTEAGDHGQDSKNKDSNRDENNKNSNSNSNIKAHGESPGSR